MAPIRRKLLAPIAAIALLLQYVGGFLVVDPSRDDGSSSSMKRSVQTTANGFSRHGHQQLPSWVRQGQWSYTNIAVFVRHPQKEKVSFTILASRSQSGAAGGNANTSSQSPQEGAGAADRATRVREMAAFVTASLTQTLISRMDPTKEVSPQEQRALTDLLEAVMTPPSPTKSSETYHDASSEKVSASDPAVTVTPPEASVEAAEDSEDQSPEEPLVVDEAIVKTPPVMVASEPIAIDDNDDTMPPKPRLEAALKKALERVESSVEATPTTTSLTGSANTTDEATDVAVSTLEKAESLHKREGDRVVALKDQFATEEVATEAGGAAVGEIGSSMSSEVPSRDNVEEKGPTTFLSNKGEATTTTTTMGDDHAAVSIVTADGPLRKVDTVQNLVPPTPDAISTAFGRPLPVVIQDVPPLKSIPELATAEKTTEVPTGTSSNKRFTSNEENAETAHNATVAAAGASTLSSSLVAEQEKVVKDEDAYGE